MEITTERLILQPISLKYREDAFREFTSEITTHMFPRPSKDISETDTFIQESQVRMKKGEEWVMAVLLKDTQEFLGCAGLHNINTNTPQLGIWIKKSAHGNKYGKEALGALKDWADKNLEYLYITYPVTKENIASRKIPESFGAKVEREFKQINLSGDELDLVEYRIYKA